MSGKLLLSGARALAVVLALAAVAAGLWLNAHPPGGRPGGSGPGDGAAAVTAGGGIKGDCSCCEASPTVGFKECSYLPPKASQLNPALTLRPRGAAGFDATVTEEAVDELFKRFNNVKEFKDIKLEAKWDDPTVNAFAFKGPGGQSVVWMMGGMLRHPYMKIEGITLVLAHEVGHHLGGPPLYPGPDKMSCEGQSDYWATRVGLRLLYGDDTPEYKGKVGLGISQAYAMLTGGLAYKYDSYEAQADLAFAGNYCGHPHPDCRKQIYEAGAAKADKPACFGTTSAGFVSYDFSGVTTLEDAKAAASGAGFNAADRKKSRKELLDEIQKLRKQLKEGK